MTNQDIKTAPLPKTLELLHESWNIYISRIKYFLFLGAIPVFFTLLAALTSEKIFQLLDEKSPVNVFIISGIGFIFIVLIWILSYWVFASEILLLKRRNDPYLKIIELIKDGWKNWIPLWWTNMLLGLVTLGGALLFILPGLYYLMLCLFAPYLTIAENRRGLDALLRSRSLVKDRLGQVIKLLLLPIIIFLFLSGLDTFLERSQEILFSSLIRYAVWMMVLGPLITCYVYRLYEELAIQKPADSYLPDQTGRKVFLALIALALFIPFILIGLFWGIFRFMYNR